MKVGTLLDGIDPSALEATAVAADQLGYESIWRGDHVVIPENYASSHPRPNSGSRIAADTPLLDPLVALAFVAAKTTRIRLGTAVYILPLRHPLVAARSVLSLDQLSTGRFIFGVGAGWLREEFECLDENFDSRLDRLREAVEVIRVAWGHPRPSFQGKYYSFSRLGFEPKAASSQYPPILVGGESSQALRTAAGWGDGWLGHWQGWEALESKLALLRELRRQSNRAQSEFDITLAIPSDISKRDLARLDQLGVARVVLVFGAIDTRDEHSRIAALERAARRLSLATGDQSIARADLGIPLGPVGQVVDGFARPWPGC